MIISKKEYEQRRNEFIPTAVLRANNAVPEAADCRNPSDKLAGRWNTVYHREMNDLTRELLRSCKSSSNHLVAGAVLLANKDVPEFKCHMGQLGGRTVQVPPGQDVVHRWEKAFDEHLAEAASGQGVVV